MGSLCELSVVLPQVAWVSSLFCCLFLRVLPVTLFLVSSTLTASVLLVLVFLHHFGDFVHP